jgi:tetratricopeptide (TPR) repeat protein
MNKRTYIFQFMRIRILGLLVISLICFSSFGQNKAKALLKMGEGRQAFLKKNYWGALDIYRQAAEYDSTNTLLDYRIGETQYALKHYAIAKKYMLKVEAANPELDAELPLVLGYIHHRLGEVEIAKEYYRTYRNNHSDSRGERVNIKSLIDQCDYAAEMIKNPLDVHIKNLGHSINSRNDDYAPSVTADGRILVFTSRRPGVSNAVDENGDYRYFEDIYYSDWNMQNQEWETAERFSENVNSPTHDGVLSMSPDGKELYVYKNDVDRAGDIFVSRFTANWSLPEKLPRPINTSYFESSVSITADGNTMFFISERPAGLGRGDIYRSQRSGNNSWSKPENLGEVINTLHDEKFVFIHPNGNTLFFASNGHLTMGSYDIFRSVYVDGAWATPVNLGYPINTVNEESTFSMTADNKKLLISAEYSDGMGERDIYEVDLSHTDILHSLNIDSELLKSKSNVMIYGRVSDGMNDKPIVFQDLKVLNANTDEKIYETRTDKRGSYEVSVPRGGSYIIQIKGREGDMKSIKVNLKGMDIMDSEQREDIVF